MAWRLAGKAWRQSDGMRCRDMELGSQIKKYRTELGLSQDALAEKIYVSRQSISNWETGKNYPDLNSLIRMSEIFHVTVDVLLKGDVEEMKELIGREDQNEFQKLSKIFSMMFLVMLISPVPLAKFLKWWGLAIWGVLAALTLAVAFLIEKKKKEWNVQTLREIIAFTEGKRLDEIEAAKEEAKRPYQKVLLAIGVGAAALVLSILMLLILK